MENIDESISIVTGALPGPTVAIFAGIHGNEKAGVNALHSLKKQLVLTKGTVYLVIANPPAVEKGVRQITKNLNRNISHHETIECYEDERANTLVKILDASDALLDLHSFNEADNHPFLICEENSNETALTLGFKYVINGMNDISLGATDGYMWTQNKIGICAELGSSDDYEKYIDLGIDTVKKFLKQFNMIEEEITTNTIDTEILQAYSLHKRRNEQFSFMKEFKTFDVIEKGELFGKDGDSELITDRESYILFPRPNNKVGIEAFALAEKR